MDTAAAAYLAMEAETDVGQDTVRAEFRAAQVDPARYGPAYALSIAWREDLIRRLDGLEFSDQVRDQVTALRAAEVALLDVERTLAGSLTVPHVYGPGNPAYPAAARARDELRRVLGRRLAVRPRRATQRPGHRLRGRRDEHVRSLPLDPAASRLIVAALAQRAGQPTSRSTYAGDPRIRVIGPRWSAGAWPVGRPGSRGTRTAPSGLCHLRVVARG